jgi:hypothetical protein
MNYLSPNPFLNLDYETALEELEDDYFEQVPAAEFPIEANSRLQSSVKIV